MWKIKHIFDGEYGCEGRLPGQLPQVSVTLTDEKGNERYILAEDAWLTEQGLEVGDHWPCELEKWRGYTNEHTDFWHKKVQ